MIQIEEAVVRQALEALKLTWHSGMPHPNIMQVGAAITALRRALEQPAQQEPVAWRWIGRKGWVDYGPTKHDLFACEPLYTHPQPRQQEPVACRYGDNGYACCEDGPCAAEEHNDKTDWQERGMIAEAVLEKLLDKSEKQKPVGYLLNGTFYKVMQFKAEGGAWDGQIPVYEHPQAREWVGLTDDEIMQMLDYGQYGRVPTYARNFVDAIEAKLKEKNT